MTWKTLNSFVDNCIGSAVCSRLHVTNAGSEAGFPRNTLHTLKSYKKQVFETSFKNTVLRTREGDTLTFTHGENEKLYRWVQKQSYSGITDVLWLLNLVKGVFPSGRNRSLNCGHLIPRGGKYSIASAYTGKTCSVTGVCVYKGKCQNISRL